MSPSAEWHARLGPLELRVGVRHVTLEDVLRERAPDAPGAGALPPPAERRRAAGDAVAAWEWEGGGLG